MFSVYCHTDENKDYSFILASVHFCTKTGAKNAFVVAQRTHLSES